MMSIPIIYPVGLLICLLVHTFCLERVTTYLVAYRAHEDCVSVGHGRITFDVSGNARIWPSAFEEFIKANTEIPSTRDVTVYSIQKLHVRWRWKWEKKSSESGE